MRECWNEAGSQAGTSYQCEGPVCCTSVCERDVGNATPVCKLAAYRTNMGVCCFAYSLFLKLGYFILKKQLDFWLHLNYQRTQQHGA